jgi:hypothetical protein
MGIQLVLCGTSTRGTKKAMDFSHSVIPNSHVRGFDPLHRIIPPLKMLELLQLKTSKENNGRIKG